MILNLFYISYRDNYTQGLQYTKNWNKKFLSMYLDMESQVINFIDEDLDKIQKFEI